MEFKPKDWVLVRNGEKKTWKLDIFSHFADGLTFPYRCVGSYYSECIPFEGNEALLGKMDKPKEKHVWHAGDRVDVLSDFDDTWYPGFIVEIDYTRSDAGFNYRVESECFKSITSTGKVWCKADQLSKPEEKPEEEFKFGDKIEANINDEWREGIFLKDDGTDLPYKIATPDGGIFWREKKDVRRA